MDDGVASVVRVRAVPELMMAVEVTHDEDVGVKPGNVCEKEDVNLHIGRAVVRGDQEVILVVKDRLSNDRAALTR